jgi:hypothetical protein
MAPAVAAKALPATATACAVRPGRRLALLALVATLLANVVSGALAETLSDFAREQFAAAEKAHREQPTTEKAQWEFARACFDLADFSTNSAQRAALAERGMAAAREAIKQNPNSAPAHYYLALNLGQLARTRGIGALKLVEQMEREFSLARNLDPLFDHAGADRALGMLYRDTPAILSIGSRSKARHHLQQAASLAPNYPDNRLTLLESYLQWGDRNGALRELKALDALLPVAREKFSGPAWAADWADWENRLKVVRPKVEEGFKGLKSPREG